MSDRSHPAGALVAWVEGARIRAPVAVAMTASLPFLGLPSAALAALTVLRRGTQDLAGVLVAALTGTVVQGLVLGAGAGVGLGRWLVFWLPVALMAAVVRSSGSLRLAVQTAVLAGAAVVVLLHVLLGDAPGFWREVLEEVLVPALTTAEGQAPNPAALDWMARLMTGMVVASSILAVVGTLCLARWVESRAVAPGRFGTEYRGLRLGRTLGAIGSVAFVVSGLTMMPLAVDLTVVFAAGFLLQGLGLVHGMVHARRMGLGWLWATYLLLVIAPPWMCLGLATAGFLDNWFDLRRRGVPSGDA